MHGKHTSHNHRHHQHWCSSHTLKPWPTAGVSGALSLLIHSVYSQLSVSKQEGKGLDLKKKSETLLTAKSKGVAWSPKEFGEFPFSPHDEKLEAMVPPGGKCQYCKPWLWITPSVPLSPDVLGLYVMLLSNVFTGLILNANVPQWRTGCHGNLCDLLRLQYLKVLVRPDLFPLVMLSEVGMEIAGSGDTRISQRACDECSVISNYTCLFR